MFNFFKVRKYIKVLENLKRDLNNPDGEFARMVIGNSAQTVANFYADKVNSFANIHSSRIPYAVRQSWTINWDRKTVSIADTNKLNKYVGPIKRSPDNPNPNHYFYQTADGKEEATSPWWFILYGWGKKGGTRKDKYKLAVVIKTQEGYKITSPFNPNLKENGGDIKVVKTMRHPGRDAKNWYEVFSYAAKSVFEEELNKNISIYMKKMGLG